MTALDDALNESSVVLGPHQVSVAWRETDNGDLATNPDSISNLSEQISGGLTITHSLDDGMPDSVTATTGNDASGILSAGLTGKEGLTLDSSGQRAFHSSGVTSGSTVTSFSAAIPSTAARGDFLICAVLIDNPGSAASVVQTAIDPKDAWTLLGTVIDSPLTLYVYATQNYFPGKLPVTIQTDVAVNYVTTTTAFWAINPTGIPLNYQVTGSTFTSEASSVTSHSVVGTLPGRGYQVGVWASEDTKGPWSMSAGGTEWGETVAATLDLMLSTSSFTNGGVNTLTGVTTTATNQALMVALSIEPYARPRMSGQQYFSPLNRQSPVFGFTRDTASVLASIRILTSSGFVDTQLFSGQMQALPVSGQGATLNAVSKTRIRLNRTVSLPIVSGHREGLTLDWLITWLMSRGSQFVGPCPNRYTRYWAPLHGSMHAHFDSIYGYNAAFYYSTAVPSVIQGTKNPESVTGPYLLGMFAQQSATRTDVIDLKPTYQLYQASDTEFPHVTEAGGPFKYDFFSQANSRGRLCFWMRADPVTSAPSYLPGGNDYILFGRVQCNDTTGAFLGWVRLGIDTVNRRAFIQMGSDAAGFQTVTYAASGLLPTDGSWRFIGFWWDFAAGTAKVYHNGTESSSSAWAGVNNDITGLPLTDEQGRRNNWSTVFAVTSHLPLSEVMYDVGIPYSAGIWDDFWPAPVSPGGNATMRPTSQPLIAIAEPTAVNAWDTLSKIAQASISAYRVDESDNYNYLPASYFGETAQITPSAVQDTTKNASSLDVTVDASMLRNVVNVQFNDTRTDTTPQTILEYNTVTDIPRGKSIITFPLDVPAVEIHGAGSPLTATYTIAKLDATAISTPTLPATHYMTVNTSPDGTGTVITNWRCNSKILYADAQSITIQFMNLSSGVLYLANNGDQVPFLHILGYGVRAVDGYVTVSDSSSVMVRGERGLDTDLPWIQDRTTATDIASTILAKIARERYALDLTVMGDPRRKPGQLITVLDAEGTAASGNWRILSVEHNANGPQYTQNLHVVNQFPTAVWDGPDGWDTGAWS